MPRTSELEHHDANKYFILAHGINLKEGQVVRAVVKGNLKTISRTFAKGLVTRRQFESILNNFELQKTYLEMAVALDEGDDEKYANLAIDIKDRPDTHCGWLDFYNKYLEKTLDMNLVPKEDTPHDHPETCII